MKRSRAARRKVTLRIAGDRRAAELLQLEVRRLARAKGLPVAFVRVRRVDSSGR